MSSPHGATSPRCRSGFRGGCGMSDGFPNKPRILRGAFVEFGLSLPPLVVVFQFNPLQLIRNRTLSFAVPNPPTGTSTAPLRTLRQFHGRYSSLLDLQKE